LASAGVLRTRRFRDLVMILLPLLWLAYYVLWQSLSRRLIHIDRSVWTALVRGQNPVWEPIDHRPPGCAARAIAAAARGDVGPALGFLFLLLLYSAATVYLASWVLDRVFAGEVASPLVRRRGEGGVGSMGSEGSMGSGGSVGGL